MSERHDEQEMSDYDKFDYDQNQSAINAIAENAAMMAKSIAIGLIGPVHPDFRPIMIREDRSSRILVAVLPKKTAAAKDDEADPLQQALKSFASALNVCGPIGDIGV